MLNMTASGTLVMGIWSLLKTFMSIFGDMGDELRTDEMPYFIAVLGVTIVFAAMFVIGISFRFIVWKGARREAESGKKGNGYIVCAVLLMAFGIYTCSSFIRKLIRGESDGYDIMEIILDITSFIILLQLLICAFSLRKVRREIADIRGEL